MSDLPASLAPPSSKPSSPSFALLFLSAAAGDTEAARHAAAQMIAAYNAETEEEISLAAEIISFRFHSLEALGHAAAAGLSLNKVLRLRGSAVSLSRKSHKAQRKLDQLQKAAAPAPSNNRLNPSPPSPTSKMRSVSSRPVAKQPRPLPSPPRN